MCQDVEETIKELKKIPGFNAYLILNNDGEDSNYGLVMSDTNASSLVSLTISIPHYKFEYQLIQLTKRQLN